MASLSVSNEPGISSTQLIFIDPKYRATAFRVTQLRTLRQRHFTHSPPFARYTRVRIRESRVNTLILPLRTAPDGLSWPPTTAARGASRGRESASIRGSISRGARREKGRAVVRRTFLRNRERAAFPGFRVDFCSPGRNAAAGRGAHPEFLEANEVFKMLHSAPKSALQFSPPK